MLSAVSTVTIRAGRSTGIPTTASRLTAWKNACRMCMRTTVFRPACPTGEWHRRHGEGGTAAKTRGGVGDVDGRGVSEWKIREDMIATSSCGNSVIHQKRYLDPDVHRNHVHLLLSSIN